MAQSNIDNINYDETLDTLEPASCFDEVRGKKGRPRKVINSTGLAVIEALASVCCTKEEIAACLGVKKDTLDTPHNKDAYLDAYEKGHARGKMSLRRHQFELSKTSAAMAIFLGKNILGQRDVIPEGDSGGTKEEHNITFIFADTSAKASDGL